MSSMFIGPDWLFFLSGCRCCLFSATEATMNEYTLISNKNDDFN